MRFSGRRSRPPHVYPKENQAASNARLDGLMARLGEYLAAALIAFLALAAEIFHPARALPGRPGATGAKAWAGGGGAGIGVATVGGGRCGIGGPPGGSAVCPPPPGAGAAPGAAGGRPVCPAGGGAVGAPPPGAGAVPGAAGGGPCSPGVARSVAAGRGRSRGGPCALLRPVVAPWCGSGARCSRRWPLVSSWRRRTRARGWCRWRRQGGGRRSRRVARSRWGASST